MDVMEISVDRFEELVKKAQESMNEIRIPVSRYEELLKKEVVYDMYKARVQQSKYADDTEKMLFEVEDKEEC